MQTEAFLLLELTLQTPLPEEGPPLIHTLAASVSCCLSQCNSFPPGALAQGVQMVGPDLLESSC